MKRQEVVTAVQQYLNRPETYPYRLDNAGYFELQLPGSQGQRQFFHGRFADVVLYVLKLHEFYQEGEQVGILLKQNREFVEIFDTTKTVPRRRTVEYLVQQEEREAEEAIRDFMFGCIPMYTNGVWKPTYQRLFPNPLFAQEKQRDLGDRIRALFGAKESILESSVSVREMRARMLRTRMGDKSEIPEYTESHGFFIDFANVIDAMMQLIYLETDERGIVSNETFARILMTARKTHAEMRTVAGTYDLGANLTISGGKIAEGPNIYLYLPEKEKISEAEATAWVEKHEWKGLEQSHKPLQYVFIDKETECKAWMDNRSVYDTHGQVVLAGPLQNLETFLNKLLPHIDMLVRRS